MRIFYRMQIIRLAAVLIIYVLGISPVSGENVKQSSVKENYKYVQGQIIVKFKKAVGNVESSSVSAGILNTYNVASAEPLFKNLKRTSTLKKRVVELSRIYKLQVPTSVDIEAMCARLNKNPHVEYAEPNYIIPVEAIPNDSLYPNQGHLPQIYMPEAWDFAKGNRSVIIAIVDTGVDWDHPDLADNIWRNPNEIADGSDSDGNGYVDDIRGWDWVEGITDASRDEDADSSDNNPMDFEGHGTFIAGIAAAVTDNSIGVSGVSWNCSIMPLRVGWKPAAGNGLLRLDWAAEAFIYAADNGADVINLSTGSSEVLVDAAKYAFDNGVVVCKSAGNDNSETTDPLDVEPVALIVAAVDDQDLKASYSSYGDWVDVSAPGGDPRRGRPNLMSTGFDDTYSHGSGTSYSSPIVAGLAGLLKSYRPEWTNADIMFQIVETADNIDELNPQYQGKLGSGRINAFRALTEQVTPKPKLSFAGIHVDDAAGGNGNGILDAGESVNIIVNLKNSWGDATNLSATLFVDDWAVQVTKNTSNLPDLPGLQDLNQSVDNSLDPFTIQIDPAALPHRVSIKIEVHGDSDAFAESEFALGISSSILVVDDDDNINNVEDYYLLALDSLGYGYDYWNHDELGTPENVLSNYPAVIWLCEWTFPSLDSMDRAEISRYLDNGGHLFLSGQDIGWDLNAEMTPGTATNEYVRSQGASMTFYENYLRTKFISDDSDYSTLAGVDNDPITDGLAFSVFQPGRDASNQYPSEIEAVNGGIPILFYPNGLAGGVRYEGDYRLVYFAFGGYEAIVEDKPRATILPRVLDWLNGVTIKHQPLPDTEDTSTDFQVEAEIIFAGTEPSRVELYWDIDDEMPFNKVPMIDQGNGHYAAIIPAQSENTITYTIFVQTTSGYTAALKFYTFRVGADLEAPKITEISGMFNRIDKKGPYPLNVTVHDNMGVDTNSVYLHFAKKGNLQDSLRLSTSEVPGRFSANVPGGYSYGDTIFYHLTAADIAAAHNRTTSPVDTMVIGLDDFESGLSAWEATPGTWGLEPNDHHSGLYSVNDSPGGILVPETQAMLTLRSGLDLSTSSHSGFYLWSKYFLRPNRDFGYIEVSTNGGETWQQIGETFKSFGSQWRERGISLDAFSGPGFDDVRLRFRLQTGSSINTNFSGWFIDDVRVVEGVIVDVAEAANEDVLPQAFYLEQNYPNPFSTGVEPSLAGRLTTNIRFAVPKAVTVKLAVYNLLGQKVRLLLDDQVMAGTHHLRWDGRDDYGEFVASGVYFYRIEADDGNFIKTQKLILMR